MYIRRNFYYKKKNKPKDNNIKKYTNYFKTLGENVIIDEIKKMITKKYIFGAQATFSKIYIILYKCFV